MQPTRDHAVAVRATAFIGRSKWLRRPVRRVRYDAYWADGRVGFNVSLIGAMYRGSPADFAPVRDAVHAHCPEVGTGSWVDERGGVIDGPSEVDRNPPGAESGRRQEFGATRRDLSQTERAGLRLGIGAVLVGVGIALVVGPLGEGIAGAVGAVLCLVGLATLAGLVPVKRRWH
jgi:hypothetical protein